jgi:predicted RND superfamily exporter protein
MTIKELADLLEVSKPTVSKALDKLNIKPQKISNRFVIDSKDIEKIIKFICPKDCEKYLEKTKKAESESAKSEKIDNNYSDNITNSANETEKSEKETAKTANDTEQQLIQMLQKALEDKENTIRSQQLTIDTLLKTNTALTARMALLEEKSQQPQEPIIIEQAETARPQEEKKLHWWNKLFHKK